MPHQHTAEAEAILDQKVEVLDHGFVTLHDYAGNDRRIAEAAWVSTFDEKPAADKSDAAVARIIRYMLKNQHTCYDYKTEVLTERGFVCWSDVDDDDRLGVWNPDANTLQYEWPKRLVKEHYCGRMYRVDHGGVDLLVTPNHNMWVSRREWDSTQGRSVFKSYRLERAESLNDASMIRYAKTAPLRTSYGTDPIDEFGVQVDSREAFFNLCGFFIGDGSAGSHNVLTFNIRKRRKIEWLAGVVEELGTAWKFYQTPYGVSCVAHENIGALFTMFYDSNLEKQIPDVLRHLQQEDALALLDGLRNSDGSAKRGTWLYSTSAPDLAQQIQIAALHAGIAAHTYPSAQEGMHTVMMLSRMHSPIVNQHRRNTRWEDYDGYVYCAETSTGVLVVRRNGKIVLSGNSPFEQVQLWFRCKMPIFVARQWVRHRTARLNEMSGRYRILPAESYVPQLDRLGGKGKGNTQGTEGELTEDLKRDIQFLMIDGQLRAWDSYSWFDNAGLANELARINLPLSAYTEWLWNIDLHNCFRFLRLRMDSHAQWEIQQYANAMYEMVKRVAPVACAAFEEYQLNAVTLSATDARRLWRIFEGSVATDEQRAEARRLLCL